MSEYFDYLMGIRPLPPVTETPMLPGLRRPVPSPAPMPAAVAPEPPPLNVSTPVREPEAIPAPSGGPLGEALKLAQGAALLSPESPPAPPQPAPARTGNPLSAYLAKIGFDPELEAAQEQAQRMGMLSLLGKGTSTIANAIATRGGTARNKPIDTSFYDQLAAQGQQGVNDLLQRRQSGAQNLEMARQLARDDFESAESRASQQNFRSQLPQIAALFPNLDRMSAREIDGLYANGFKLADDQRADKQLAQTAELKKQELAQSEALRRDEMRLRETEGEKGRAAARANVLDQIASHERLAGQKAGDEKSAHSAKMSSDLRKELMGNPAVKSAVESKVSFDKLRSGLSAKTAAGDMAAIFSFMKALDPGSTVREGEYANAQNAGGVADRMIVRLYNKAVDGQMLTPDQRKDFLARGKDLFDNQAKPARQLLKQYGDLAEKSGLNRADVVLDLGLVDVVERRQDEDGTILELLSDGTIREVK